MKKRFFALILAAVTLFSLCACATPSNPVTDPVTDPITDPAADPVTDPATSPATDPATEPATDPVTGLVTDPATIPVTNPVTDPTTDPVTDPVTEPVTDSNEYIAYFNPTAITEDLSGITGTHSQTPVYITGSIGIPSLAGHAKGGADGISVSLEEDNGEKAVRLTNNETCGSYTQLYINLDPSVFTDSGTYYFSLTFRLNEGHTCTDSKGRVLLARLVDTAQNGYTVLTNDDLAANGYTEWTTVDFSITAPNGAPTVLRVLIFGEPGDYIEIKSLAIYDHEPTSTPSETDPVTDPVTEPIVWPDNTGKSSEFNENNVVFSFGAISDVHIDVKTPANKGKFTNAIQQLMAFAEKNDANGLDAFLVAGDMISNNSKGPKSANSEISRFATIIKEFENPSFGTNVLLTVGNHDSRHEYSMLPAIKDTYLGAEYFAMDVESDLEKGWRHSVINGYHFVICEPSDQPAGFDKESLNWIDKTLAKITAEEPDKYVFFVTHPTIANTVYGSEDDFEPGHNRWRSLELGKVLSKYPQVITFSGHTHSPIFDERCIMQTGFTALNTGSVANTAFELEKYENMVNNTLPTLDNSEVSTGLLVQVDGNGNVRVTRLMFSEKAEMKTPWELSYPKQDGSHLTKYTREGREAANEAPVLTGEITVTPSDSAYSATVSFNCGTDDDFVHHYVITATDISTGKVITEYYLLTDFFAVTDVSEMIKTFSYDIPLAKANCKITIKAVDCWDRESATISATVDLSSVNH